MGAVIGVDSLALRGRHLFTARIRTRELWRAISGAQASARIDTHGFVFWPERFQ